MRDLKVEVLRVDDLIPYCRNSREHSAEQITQIASSLREFGFTNPVLIDEAGTIIAGHGRVLAARKLQMKEVPCIRLLDLTESQKRAYVIIDNQLGANAHWNWDMLAVEVEELLAEGYGSFALGFSDEQLEELIGSPNDPPEISSEEQKKPVKETIICPKCHHDFVP